MSEHLHASSSPVGGPPNARSADPVRILDEESEIPDSSQMELVELPTDAPNSRRNKGKQPDYKECSNTDSETQDATYGAGAESEDAAEDIPARRMITGIQTRSRSKKEAENFEMVTPAPTRRSITTKRSHGNHQAETTRPAKRGRPSTGNSLVNKMKKEALGWVEIFDSSIHELEATRSENQKLESAVKFWKSKFEQEQTDRNENESALEQEISGLRNDCIRWKIKLEHALDELKNDSAKYVKVSDLEIKMYWMLLSYNIRDLVSQCLIENPANQDTILKSLIPSHQFLSMHDMSTLRAYILRRTIWISVILPVFSGRQPVWQGEIGATLTQLLFTKNFFHKDDAKYLQIISQIKYRAVADLSDECHLNLEAMEVMIGKVTTQLGPFIIGLKVEYFKNNMKKLITEAADLHSIFMKSKAIFVPQWFGDGNRKQLVPFDRTKMVPFHFDTEVDASKSLVKFVEAPGLWKIGSADGEEFDTRMILCESSVILQEVDDDIGDEEEGDKNRGSKVEFTSWENAAGWIASKLRTVDK